MNPSKPRNSCVESLRSWIIIIHLGILVHLGRSFFAIFEILNNYGTSWKINTSNLESLKILNTHGTSWKTILTPKPAPDHLQATPNPANRPLSTLQQTTPNPSEACPLPEARLENTGLQLISDQDYKIQIHYLFAISMSDCWSFCLLFFFTNCLVLLLESSTGPPQTGYGTTPDRLRDNLGRVQGWESVFWDFMVSWKSQRFKKLIVPKYQDSRPIWHYSKNQYFSKNMFDLLGFTYVFKLFTIIQDLLRFHHRNFPFWFKTFGRTNGSGPPEFENNISKKEKQFPNIILLEDNHLILPKLHFMFSSGYWYPLRDFERISDGSSSFVGVRLFQNVSTNGFPESWDMKIIYVQKMFPYFWNFVKK